MAVAGRANELFDVAKPRGEGRVEIDRGLRRERPGHPRVVQPLHGRVIACVEPIDHRSSDCAVALRFLGGNCLCNGRHGRLVRIGMIQRLPERVEEPHADKPDLAPDGDLPEGHLEFHGPNPLALGGRHRDNDGPQIGGVRLLDRCAGFGGMEQRFQLCFQRQKLPGPRPLVEPVNDHSQGDEEERGQDLAVDRSGQASQVAIARPIRQREQIPPQHRAQVTRARRLEPRTNASSARSDSTTVAPGGAGGVVRRM